ncbi:MAG: hypothetical protein NTY07_13720 [Bacteroidia bacterium]|nr:hypothetical protein [Bacteroidia bacterium]
MSALFTDRSDFSPEPIISLIKTHIHIQNCIFANSFITKVISPNIIMKRLLMIIALVGYAFIGFTQEQKPGTTLEQDSVTLRKNVLKFLPMDIPFQSVSFEYERMIGPKNSLTLGVGFPIQGQIISKNAINDNSKLKKAEFSTMHIRAAYRYYYGYQILPKGFYIEPYLKYQQIKGNANYEGINNQKNIYKGDITGSINTFNLGVQFGVQFLITKRVTLDLYFLGLEGGLANGKITSTSKNNADADNIEADFKDAVAGLPFFIENWLTVKKANNQVFINASKLQYPWYRGGISIGIAF